MAHFARKQQGNNTRLGLWYKQALHYFLRIYLFILKCLLFIFSFHSGDIKTNVYAKNRISRFKFPHVFNSVVADSCLIVFRSLFWLCLNECRA